MRLLAAACPAALCVEAALPQCVLDDLLHAGGDALLRLCGPCPAQLDVAEGEQVAEVGALGGRGVGGEDGCFGALAQDLARGVEGAEERGWGGLGRGAERAVEIAQGAGGGEVGVGDAGAGELEEALEQLGRSVGGRVRGG